MRMRWLFVCCWDICSKLHRHPCEMDFLQFCVVNCQKRAYIIGRCCVVREWSGLLWSITLVSGCFEPSQPQRITSGLYTNFTLSPSHSFHKSSYHKSCFLSLFIFHGYSTWEPASSRVTYFIPLAYTGTGVSHSQHRKKLGEVLEKMQVNGLEG